MKKILLAVFITLLITAPTAAVGASYVTGKSIKDNTVQAQDLGDSVTKMQTVSITVLPSDDDWACDDEMDDETCHPVDGSGGGIHVKTVYCASGNLSSAGWIPVNLDEGYNLEVYANGPISDQSWKYAFYNTGPDPIKIRLNYLCI